MKYFLSSKQSKKIFSKAMKKFLLSIGAFVFLFSSSPVYACSVCFGKTDAKTIKALQISVLTLLGFLALVMVGFLSIVFQIRRKNKLSPPTDLHIAHP